MPLHLLERKVRKNSIESTIFRMIAPMTPRDRLIIALDFDSPEEILRTAGQLHGLVGMFKIGLQAFIANGPAIVTELVRRGEKVLLDLKLHDIPNTAGRAVGAASRLGASMITVHAAGGSRMMIAAARAAEGSPLRLLGVTILTSLDADELRHIGYQPDVPANVRRLAIRAQKAGLQGVVASPQEIRLIRETCGDGFLIVTPGIRSAQDQPGDQRRTMTAREAVRAGADHIVIGRPITGAPEPRAAAQRILDELSN